MNKKIILVTILIIIVTRVQLFAQYEKQIKNKEVNGFYHTAIDFKKGILTNPTDKVHKGDKIKLKQFFISSKFISIEEHKKTIFYKDSIFAIHLNNGENYRFINNTPCLITDTSYLYIYTLETTKIVHEISDFHRSGREITIKYYYFSVGNHKDVYDLTLLNLSKYAFTDFSLYTAIYSKYTSDEMLTKINAQTGRFELNETILSILKKK